MLFFKYLNMGFALCQYFIHYKEKFPGVQLRKLNRMWETNCATYNLNWNLQLLKASQKLFQQTKGVLT